MCKQIANIYSIKATEFDKLGFQYSGQASKEVTVIRSMAPINLIVYYPKTAEGQEELAKRVSDVHAAATSQQIKSLNCPTSQKLELLDAVIEIMKGKQGTDLMESLFPAFPVPSISSPLLPQILKTLAQPVINRRYEAAYIFDTPALPFARQGVGNGTAF